MSQKQERLWWERGTIYQVYPRSFQDSNGDGIGDLAGIASRLDYLSWLGVDAIWLSPINPSPMADFGYDVSDYIGIDPLFGTMDDFDALLRAVHDRGMKLLLDYVPNHTSEQHAWFIESRSSRTSPKRDWYIWRDPAPDGGPPTNWLSNFGGSAWELDERTGQYYYHAFLRQQPDLNWRNPEVRAAMHDNLRFWLDRGVDGFRVDVIWHLIKDDQFRDNPPNPDYLSHQSPHREVLSTFTEDRPEVHDIIAEMRAVLEEYDERMMVGEIYLPVERLVEYYGDGGTGAHLPFNFHLLHVPWNGSAIAATVEHYESMLPPYGWPNWVLGNHDNHRLASRIGINQARMAGMLLLTLRGTPTLYYGDEIGMHDVPIPPHAVQDPYEKNVPGLGLGRDPERTPMQWNASPGAGFTTGVPWLPIAADHDRVNVAAQREDRGSMLSLYRALLALRRAEPALAIGDYETLYAGETLYVFARHHGGKSFAVLLNFCPEPQTVHASVLGIQGRIALSTHRDRTEEALAEKCELRGNEGVIVELTGGAPGGRIRTASGRAHPASARQPSSAGLDPA
jgi:alpha-glucosidase